MSVLNVSQLNYSVGIEEILKDVSCNVNAGDRVGIVGVNGAGKSTFLKIIMNDYAGKYGRSFASGIDEDSSDFFENLSKYEADSGSIQFSKGLNLRYLNLQKLEDSYYGKDVSTMSGGEKVRVALEGLFMEKPDFVILDEPTNHLDIAALQWLEARLRNFKGSFLIVSHDRYFLDRVCNKIFEIERKTLTAYNGNYSEYKRLKQIRYDEDLRHYENQMKEIRRQEDIAREFRNRATEKMIIRAKARETMISKMERPEKPTVVREDIRVSFKQNLQTGNDVIITEGLGFKYENGPFLIKDLDLIVKKGDRVLITGPNGCGKTTFLKMLLGELPPTEGRIKLGTNVVPAYYDQQQASLIPENSVLEELYNSKGIIIGPGEYVSVESKYNETELRKLLGAFCFRGDDVFKKVGSLAGGEKARLALLKLMMSGANVLILDEPTNHLDISSKEIFEDALMAFPGTEVIVSHDRYLIDKVSTRVVALGESSAMVREGGTMIEQKYRSLEEIKQNEAKENLVSSLKASGLSDAEANRQAKKAEETNRRRLEKQKAAAEEEVSRLEALVSGLEEKLCSPEVFEKPEEAKKLSSELEKAKAQLEEAYNLWMELE